MKYLTRASGLCLVAAALLSASACSSESALPTEAQAPSAKRKVSTVVKFTFNDVTFPDGVVGAIYAGSKDADKSDFTHCDYTTPNGDEYLGQFESDQFSSKDADEVLAFCLSHYADRQ